MLDATALQELYVKLEKPIFNVVYRWLWNAGDAQDVTHEAFLRVWKARDRVDLVTATPLLYRTALNLASNRRRSRRLWGFIGLEAASTEPSVAPTSEDALEIARMKKRVRDAVESLPERLRQVIVLCEYSELTYEEIGKALGIPEGTVGSRRNAAIAALVDRVGPIEGLSP